MKLQKEEAEESLNNDIAKVKTDNGNLREKIRNLEEKISTLNK